MPGIAGIITKQSVKDNKHNLRLMIDCMLHEPFYESGVYINEDMGLYLGWVSHKGSFSDCMPVVNEEKNLVLLFAGENFADNEQTIRLRSRGHEFIGSNASYLIHLYEEDGEGFLQHLNGWFSGILVDIKLAKVLLFNDRYGMQRIYYHEAKDTFLFSSEAKSLMEVRASLREIDVNNLGEFFSFGCVLENRTLFSKISLLPGGSAWTFYNSNCATKGSYFQPQEWENQPTLEKESFYNRFKETFPKILPRYFNSDDRVAVSLTGGLDTRMIMAGVNNLHSDFSCYTFGGMFRDSFDVRISRKVADTCNRVHQVLRLDNDFLLDFPNLAEKTVYITEGTIDLTGVPDLYLNKLARDIAPVRITGNYGSEVLRGVRSLKAFPINQKIFHHDFIKNILNAESLLSEIQKGHGLTFAVFKQAPWFGYGRFAVEQSQLTIRNPFMDNDVVKLAYQAPNDAITTKEISMRFIAEHSLNLYNIVTDRGVGGGHNYFFSKFIRLYYEFLFKAEYYYNHGMPQWMAVLNHFLSPLQLEKLFLGYHKFYHFRIWYKDQLADYLRIILMDSRTTNRPYLNKNFLINMVSGHINGNRNYTDLINKVLTVELVQRLLIEKH